MRECRLKIRVFGKDRRMSLLMIGSFPLMMTVVLMIAVWAERYLADKDDLIPVDDPFDKGFDASVPQAAPVSKPEL